MVWEIVFFKNHAENETGKLKACSHHHSFNIFFSPQLEHTMKGNCIKLETVDRQIYATDQMSLCECLHYMRY